MISINPMKATILSGRPAIGLSVHPGRPDAPEVRGAIDDAFRTILAAGKIPGSTGPPDAIAGLVRQGIRYTYTHLTRLLAQAGREFLHGARVAGPQ